MRRRVIAALACLTLLLLPAMPAAAQGNRGKAELSTPGGSVTVDYGRPSLKGRDMLSQLKEGTSWRMGMNQATVLTTPVDLTFGSTKVPKGSYSLFLAKGAGDTYQLLFNSQTGQWGTQHDSAKDAASVPLNKTTAPSSVEVFTIDLKPETGGGTFVMTWGTTQLSADFKAAQ